MNLNLHNSTYHNIEAANYAFKAKQSFGSALVKVTNVCSNPKFVGIVLYNVLMVTTPFSLPVVDALSSSVKICNALFSLDSSNLFSLGALTSVVWGVMFTSDGMLGLELVKLSLYSAKDFGVGVGYVAMAVAEKLKSFFCEFSGINDDMVDLPELLEDPKDKTTMSYEEKMQLHHDAIYKASCAIIPDILSFGFDLFLTFTISFALEEVTKGLMHSASHLDSFVGLGKLGLNIENIPVFSSNGFENSIANVTDLSLARKVGKLADWTASALSLVGMKLNFGLPDSSYIVNHCNSNIFSLKSIGYYSSSYIDKYLSKQCTGNLGESSTKLAEDITSLAYHGTCEVLLAGIPTVVSKSFDIIEGAMCVFADSIDAVFGFVFGGQDSLEIEQVEVDIAGVIGEPAVEL
ncbi:MAG TPA: hypothetical protein QKA08_01005 [Candidatus Megaira endosymbiont of Nemacystus decipiens]|nr:hypothetical protein [Candidatus Megaera endosymbiont of Nemacystus decipiens]